MGFLCESLKTNTTLETLDMQGAHGNKLGAAEAKIIADMLKVNAPLNKLKLNYAELPIGELKTAISVDLSNKRLQPTDAIIIASLMSMVNAPLTDLNIAANSIGVEGAKALAAVLPRCVQLQSGMHSAPSDASN